MSIGENFIAFNQHKAQRLHERCGFYCLNPESEGEEPSHPTHDKSEEDSTETLDEHQLSFNVSNTFFNDVADGLYMFIQNHHGQWILNRIKNHSSGHVFSAKLVYDDFVVKTETAGNAIPAGSEYSTLEPTTLHPFVRSAGEICILSGKVVFWSLKSGSFNRKESDYQNTGINQGCYISVSTLRNFYNTKLIHSIININGEFHSIDSDSLDSTVLELYAPSLISALQEKKSEPQVAAFISRINNFISITKQPRTFMPLFDASAASQQRRQAEDTDTTGELDIKTQPQV